MLKDYNIDYYIPSYNKKNINIKPDLKDIKPEKFWEDDAVTISKIARAKGNEAPMVYIVGIEEIAENESDISYRNKLFTALTRAKCWVKIMGVGSYTLYDEIEKAIESKEVFI